METKNFNFKETSIQDVYIIEPIKSENFTGYFTETYNEKQFKEAGLNYNFIQDNQVKLLKGMLSGLRFQKTFSQAKLIHCIEGKVFVVTVDLRENSLTYGKYESAILSANLGNQLIIPHGFAYGFLALSDTVTFCCKCDELDSAGNEDWIIWNDPTININWPKLDCEIVLLDKDISYKLFDNFNMSNIVSCNIPNNYSSLIFATQLDEPIEFNYYKSLCYLPTKTKSKIKPYSTTYYNTILEWLQLEEKVPTNQLSSIEAVNNSLDNTNTNITPVKVKLKIKNNFKE